MSSSWLFGTSTTREDMEEKLNVNGSNPDGRFGVRRREDNNSYVLSVNYRGKATHHLVVIDGGVVKINKKDYGQGWSSIEEAIDQLRTSPPSGWPVKLTSAAGEAHDGSSTSSEAPKAKRKSSTMSAAGDKPTTKTVVHKEMSKAAANDLAIEHLGTTDGNFFVRKRGGEFPKDYILTVIFRGKPTQHLVEMGPEGTLKVNKKESSCKTIMTLLGKCRNKQPWWPVPLQEYLNVNMEMLGMGPSKRASKASVASVTPSAKTSSSSSESSEKLDYLHPPMSKPEADELMRNDGSMEDGKFFIRSRENEDEFVMCVVYRGKPTHHLITKTDGEFYINKKPTGGSTSLAAVVQYLRGSGRPGWPVPLKSHVSNGSGVETTRKSESEPEPEPEPEPETQRQSQQAKRDSSDDTDGVVVEKDPSLSKPVSKTKTVGKISEVEKEPEQEPEPEPEPEETPAERAAREKKERDEARAKELMDDPNKLWVKGQKLDVTIARPSLAHDFGFSIGSKFRIAGRAKVVTRVRVQSPAANVLKVGDEILSLMDEPVFDWELEDVKLALRNLGLGFTARVFRPHKEELEPPKGANLEPKLPTTEEMLAQQAKSSTMFTYRNGVRVKASNSLYCPCRNRYESELKKNKEQERIQMQIRKRLMKSAAGAKMTAVKKDTTFNKMFEDSMA